MSRPDLYRSGNASSPRFDNVRPQDIPVDAEGYVRPGTGGISTFSDPFQIQPQKNIWRLPGSAATRGLRAVNDRGTHWSIEPDTRMLKTAYVGHLQVLNGEAVKYTPPMEAHEVQQLPEHSTHVDKATRFIFNALATVVRDRIPVPGIADWDDNDYAYVAILAQGLEEGRIELTELVWDASDEVTRKEKEFTAAVISAYLADEAEKKLGKGNDDDEADFANDSAYLRTILKFDDPSNRLASYAELKK